jgi:hypothetical protein
MSDWDFDKILNNVSSGVKKLSQNEKVKGFLLFLFLEIGSNLYQKAKDSEFSDKVYQYGLETTKKAAQSETGKRIVKDSVNSMLNSYLDEDDKKEQNSVEDSQNNYDDLEDTLETIPKNNDFNQEHEPPKKKFTTFNIDDDLGFNQNLKTYDTELGEIENIKETDFDNILDKMSSDDTQHVSSLEVKKTETKERLKEKDYDDDYSQPKKIDENDLDKLLDQFEDFEKYNE